MNKRDAKKTPMSVGTGTGHSIIQKSHHSLPIPGPRLQKSPSNKVVERTGIQGRRERRIKRKYNSRCTAKSRRRMEGGVPPAKMEGHIRAEEKTNKAMVCKAATQIV